MATITSGVGLYSGIDYSSLVDQLIAIDAAPRNQLNVRISNIDAQRTALMDISARVSALLTRVSTLTTASFFRGTTASSSNPGVLSASTGDRAMPGSYSFTVHSLATTHQVVSRGFTSPDAAATPGTFSLESAAARVNSGTTLEELNGFTGVQRGSFKLIDGEGEEAVINLHDAQTISDVIDRINEADVGVRAELRGEAIALTETTGGTMGLRVREVGDGHAAGDLGFDSGNTYSADGELLGDDLVYLAPGTPLSALNDGLGLRRATAGTDFTIQSAGMFSVDVRLSEVITDTTRLERLNHGRGVELGSIRITTKDAETTEIDLSEAQTIGDVKNAIEDAVEGVSVVLAGGRLVITDTTEADDSDFAVMDVEGNAARDLGILGTTEGDKIDGSQILHVDTLADVIAAINYGQGNQYDVDGNPLIEASIDPSGNGLLITDRSSGSFKTIISAADVNSQALYDLGFAPGEYGMVGEGAEISGQRVIGGLDTVLLKTLNGGQGFDGGTISISANGASANIDLAGAETLRDVIELINQASADSGETGLQIEAGYDSTGTRLQISNLLDDGSQIVISDIAGEFAASTGIASSGTRISSDNLQRRYISENTQLEDLNLGAGVALGSFKVTDSNGRVGEVNLATEHAETLQDVIDAINNLSGVEVEARINDTGDGLTIIDTAGGDGPLKITEGGTTTARDLNILGESDDEETKQIDGSYEIKLDTTGSTLTDLVDQINGTTLAYAHLINDGSPTAPYRLSISSLATGLTGELIVDSGGTDLSFATLTRAQNASVSLGSDGDSGLMITSSTNTISDVVNGLTLNLSGVDDEPITVTIDRDMDTMLSTLSGLVDDYNSLISRIDTYSSYDSETETKGVLFADSTLRTIETRLFRSFTGAVPGAEGQITRLSEVGVKFGSGAKLSFDEEKFREAFEADPEGVAEFFTAAETGLAHQLEDQLQRMTETGGLIKRRDNSLQDQQDMLSQRVTRLNELLELKRLRLLREYQAMEQVLSQLQTQQTAIAGIASLTTYTGTTSA